MGTTHRALVRRISEYGGGRAYGAARNREQT
jgi:hypothetical protein